MLLRRVCSCRLDPTFGARPGSGAEKGALSCGEDEQVMLVLQWTPRRPGVFRGSSSVRDLAGRACRPWQCSSDSLEENMERTSTGLDGKLDLEATSAGRHTLLSEPANGRRGYAGTKARPLASGADTVRLTSFFSGSGGGWMVGLLKEGG